MGPPAVPGALSMGNFPGTVGTAGSGSQSAPLPAMLCLTLHARIWWHATTRAAAGHHSAEPIRRILAPPSRHVFEVGAQCASVCTASCGFVAQLSTPPWCFAKNGLVCRSGGLAERSRACIRPWHRCLGRSLDVGHRQCPESCWNHADSGILCLLAFTSQKLILA